MTEVCKNQQGEAADNPKDDRDPNVTDLDIEVPIHDGPDTYGPKLRARPELQKSHGSRLVDSLKAAADPARPAVEVHPLAGFSVRELLEAVRARALVVGGYDGRMVADTIATWTDGTSQAIGNHLLDLRAVSMGAVPIPAWQTRLVAAQDGRYSTDGCTSACWHFTPRDALQCTARADG